MELQNESESEYESIDSIKDIDDLKQLAEDSSYQGKPEIKDTDKEND